MGSEVGRPTTAGPGVVLANGASGLRRLVVTVALATLFLLALASQASALTLGVGWTSEQDNVPEMPLVGASGATTFRVPQGAITDDVVRAAAESHVTILAQLGGGETLPGNRAAFRQQVTEMVHRYGVNGSFWSINPNLPAEPITTWEVWNEANLKGISPQEFGFFVNEIAETIDSSSLGGNPEVLVGGILADGNLGPTGKPWQLMYEEGKGTTLTAALQYLAEMWTNLGPHVDGIAIHPYELNPASFFTPPGEPTYSRIEAFRYAVNRFHAKLLELGNGNNQLLSRRLRRLDGLPVVPNGRWGKANKHRCSPRS